MAAHPILDHVRKIVARISRDVTVVSVLAGDAELGHAYEVDGGPDHGRRFDTLLAVSQYVRAVTLQAG